tara:strand:- start:14293 stop:14544 length:252 start_codon:yes stop_codon:yes gene_type:complete
LRKLFGIFFFLLSTLFGFIFIFSLRGTIKALTIFIATGINYDSSASIILTLMFQIIPGLLGFFFFKLGKALFKLSEIDTQNED